MRKPVRVAEDQTFVGLQTNLIPEQVRHILSSITDGVYIVDHNEIFLYANNQALKFLHSSNNIIGKSIQDLYTNYKNTEFYKYMQVMHVSRKADQFEIYSQDYSQWFEVRLYPSQIGCTVFLSDITPRKRDEANKVFTSHAGQILSSSLDYNQTLDRVASLAVPHIADWCTVDLLESNGTLRTVTIAHSRKPLIAWAKRMREKMPRDLRIEYKIIETGESFYVPEISQAMLDTATNEIQKKILKRINVSSLMMVPLKTYDHVTGVITFLSTDANKRYTKQDLDMAEDLARFAALAVENARLYKEAQEEIYLRQQVNEALEESQQRFIKLFELAPDFIYNITAAGILVSLNPAFEKITRWKARDWIGKSFTALIHPDDIQYANEKFYAGLEGKGLDSYILRIRKKDGTYLIGEFRNAPYVVNGVVVGKYGIARDVTHRKKIEEQIIMLASAVANAGDAIFSKKLDGTITSWNAGAQRMYGYTAKEVIGQPVKIIIPQDRQYEFAHIMHKIKQGQRVVRLETQRVKKNGKHIDVSVSVSPIMDNDQNIIGASSIASDITQRIQMERELRHSRDQLEIIFRTVADGITVQDPSGKLLYVNNAAAQICGFENAKQMLEIPVAHITDRIKMVDEQGKSISAAALPGRVALAGKQSNELVIGFYNKESNENRWSTIKATPVFDEFGNVQFAVNVFHDITESKILEKRKDDFIGIASHELKTPVTSMKAFTQILQTHYTQSNDPDSKKYLDKIDAQLNRLTKLINDLLNVSKAQSGKLEYTFETFNLTEYIFEMAADLQKTELQHKLLFNNQKEIIVTADKDRIGQVLINLITNAIKYSPKADKVAIGIKQSPTEVTVTVEDFGVGIPKALHNKVFERFYRINGRNGETYPGLGLGLYIASEIVKRHGGKIWIENKRGNGVLFCFSIPRLVPKS